MEYNDTACLIPILVDWAGHNYYRQVDTRPDLVRC